MGQRSSIRPSDASIVAPGASSRTRTESFDQLTCSPCTATSGSAGVPTPALTRSMSQRSAVRVTTASVVMWVSRWEETVRVSRMVVAVAVRV